MSLSFKYHQGRPTTKQIWVCGLVDTSHTPSLRYMEVVPHRDANTLLPLITAYVAPGKVMYSDEWATYNQVQRLSNVSSHDVVNHSVNLTTGVHVHTQNVESFWNRVKIKLRRMRRCHGEHLPNYLEFTYVQGMPWYISIFAFFGTAKHTEGYCCTVSIVIYNSYTQTHIDNIIYSI